MSENPRNPYKVRPVKVVPKVIVNKGGTPVRRDKVIKQFLEILHKRYEQYVNDIMTRQKYERVKNQINSGGYHLSSAEFTNYSVNIERRWETPGELVSFKRALEELILSIPPTYRNEAVCECVNSILFTKEKSLEYWPVEAMKARPQTIPWPHISDLQNMMLICLMVGVQHATAVLVRDGAYYSDVTEPEIEPQSEGEENTH